MKNWKLEMLPLQLTEISWSAIINWNKNGNAYIRSH